jgi:hypothetical protein
MADINRKGDQDVRLVDTTTQVAAAIRTGGHQTTEVADSTTGYKLKPRSDGTLDVNANIGGIPPIPEGATQVIVESGTSDVSSTAGVDTLYTITNLLTLTIQSLLGGAEESSGGSVIQLFEDPNGDLSVLNEIAVPLFVSGQTYQLNIGESFVGNGTRRIVLRRRGYTASAREMAGTIYGYTETT